MKQPVWKLFLVLIALATCASAQEENSEVDSLEEVEKTDEDDSPEHLEAMGEEDLLEESDETGEEHSLEESIETDEEHSPESDMLTPEQVQGLVGQMDTDLDGKVSMEEILNFASKMRHQLAHKESADGMESMDEDSDGAVSLVELLRDLEELGEHHESDKLEIAARKQLEEARFKAADEDGDGKLEPKELAAIYNSGVSPRVNEVAAAEMLKQRDSNGDGSLTSKEFWERSDGTDPTDEEEQEFKRLDKSGDGKLSVKEIMAYESGVFHLEEAMHRLFDMADNNSDMHLSIEELHNAREAIVASDAHYHLLEWAEHNEL